MPKPEGAVRDIIIRFRVDPEEKADLLWAAKKDGMELGTWLRRLGLKDAEQKKKQGLPQRARRG